MDGNGRRIAVSNRPAVLGGLPPRLDGERPEQRPEHGRGTVRRVQSSGWFHGASYVEGTVVPLAPADMGVRSVATIIPRR